MDPATIAGIGTFLGGAGSLASAFKGGGGSSDFARKLARNPLMYQIRDAEKYGIHPLAAIGIQPRYSAPHQVGKSNDYEKMGQAISTMARTPMEKELAKIKLAQEKAILQGMRLSNVGKAREELNKNQPNGTGQTPLEKELNIPGQASPLTASSHLAVTPREVIPSKQMGLEVGVGAADSHYINEHGSLYPVLSEKAAEGLESDTFASKQRHRGKQFDYIKRMHAYQLPNHPASQSTIKHLKDTRPKAPKGYEARYNAWRGLWVIRPKIGGKSYLFDKKRNDQYRMWSGRKQYKMKKSH